MAKIQILGNAAVVTSTMTTEVIKTLSKFKPKALKLIDAETKDELFTAALGSTPCFSKHGAVFTNTNELGKAQFTVGFPTSIAEDKKKEFIQDNYGYALLNLNKLEAQVAAIMAETTNEFVQISEAIEIL